jgi:electron transfer flavoprotein alpha subunit
MLLAATSATLAEYEARLVFASGDCRGREWSARLAVRLGWRLVSPALMVEVLEDGGAEVTGLDAGGRLARKVRIGPGDAAVVTMRPGVGEAQTRDASRNGETAALEVGELSPDAPWTTREELIAADPATVDIRFANRLVAGGRGVGGERGFERLRRFASRIGASVAASRMAVDLGWVERERQVGQTGRTVAPDLYVACGISGASHHLAGMSESDRIVAINSDPQAPIFKVAHLGLITDLHDLLAGVEEAVAGG